jgi:hypothetical protein
MLAESGEPEPLARAIEIAAKETGLPEFRVEKWSRLLKPFKPTRNDAAPK